jgi:hypothetical protein
VDAASVDVAGRRLDQPSLEPPDQLHPAGRGPQLRRPATSSVRAWLRQLCSPGPGRTTGPHSQTGVVKPWCKTGCQFHPLLQEEPGCRSRPDRRYHQGCIPDRLAHSSCPLSLPAVSCQSFDPSRKPDGQSRQVRALGSEPRPVQSLLAADPDSPGDIRPAGYPQPLCDPSIDQFLDWWRSSLLPSSP